MNGGHGEEAQQEQQQHRRTQARFIHPPASSNEPLHPARPIYNIPFNGREASIPAGAGKRGDLLCRRRGSPELAGRCSRSTGADGAGREETEEGSAAVRDGRPCLACRGVEEAFYSAEEKVSGA